MKRLYFLSMFLLLATFVAAQRNTEFGLTLKAGNFTIPQKGTWSGGYTWVEDELKAGWALRLGCFGRLPMGRLFSVSGEMLVSFSQYAREEGVYGDVIFPPPIGNYTFSRLRYSMMSVIIPLKLDFRPAFTSRTTFSAGFASSYAFLSYLRSEVARGTLPPTVTKSRVIYNKQNGEKDARWQILFLASVQQQITEQVSIGLEFAGTMGKNSFDRREQEPYKAAHSLLWMKSLSFSMCYTLWQ
jgi:hypothetical protein